MTIAQAYVFGAHHRARHRPEHPRRRGPRRSHLVASFLAVMARRDAQGRRHHRPPARRRRHAVPAAGDLPPPGHPPLPRAAAGVAPAAPDRRAAVQRQRDVEATWYPIAPFPFAVGVVVMLVVDARRCCSSPTRCSRWSGSVVFPAIAVLTVVYSRRMSPLMTRAQQLRGEVSAIAHESLRRRARRQDARPRGRRDRRGSARSRARAARHPRPRSAGCAALFDPMMEALPVLGVLVVLLVGTSRVGSGDITAASSSASPTCSPLLAFPVRAIGWVLNELPRSVVGWDRVQRVLDGRRARRRYGDRRARRPHGPAALSVSRRCRFAYGDDGRCCASVDLRRPRRAGRSRSSARPAPASRRWPSLLVRLVDPATGRCRVRRRRRPRARARRARRGRRARAAADVPVRRHRARQRHARRRRRRRATSGPRCASRRPTASSRRCRDGARHRRRRARHDAVRRPAAAAGPGPRRRPPPAAARPRRRDEQRRPAGRAAHPGRPARRAAPPARSSSSPTAARRSRSPTRSSSSSDGRVVARGTHDELLARSTGLPRPGARPTSGPRRERAGASTPATRRGGDAHERPRRSTAAAADARRPRRRCAARPAR